MTDPANSAASGSGEGAGPEFSFEIELGEPGRRAKTFALEADAAQCARVAARIGALSLSRLDGSLEVATTKAEIFVTGVVRAQMVRECVASLEPVDETVEDEFEVVFSRLPEDPGEEAGEEDWMAPEVHLGASLDIGELLVQQLSLAMDPFPRKPGAKSLADEYAPKETISPFSALQGAFKKTPDNQ